METEQSRTFIGPAYFGTGHWPGRDTERTALLAAWAFEFTQFVQDLTMSNMRNNFLCTCPMVGELQGE